MADIVYVANLDDSQVSKALQNIDKNIDKLASNADKSFQNVGKSAHASGVQIGFISGAVSALTNELINMSKRGLEALANLTGESVGLATELDSTAAVFKGIFQGNEQAATAALQRIRSESRGLGIDISEVSKAFLPFVKNLDEATRIGKISAALELAQPEQKGGARIALQELLSGNARSLVQRFEIPRELGKQLEEALKTGGASAAIGKLEEILKSMGRDLDSLGDTAQISFNKVKISAEQLKTAFGVPITDELKKQFDDLNKVVDANFDDFEGLATLAGNVIAEIASGLDAAGVAQFFADNKQEIAEFLTALREIVKSAKDLADIDLSGGINVDTLTQAALKIDQLVNGLNAIKQITQGAPAGLQGGFISGLEGALSGLFPGVSAFIEIWQNLDKVIKAVIATYGLFVATAAKGQAYLNNSYQEFLAVTGQIEEGQKQLIDPQKAYQDVIDQTNAAIQAYRDSTKEAADAVNAATIPTKESTSAGEDAANAMLAQRDAARELAQAEEERAAAEEKVAKATAKIETDLQRDLLEADIKYNRARMDALQDFAREREDAARKNLEKIADIELKNQQAIQDAATDLSRKEEDIATKHAREKIEQERDQRQKRVDIEVDYRRKLADIRHQFDLDAEEAERNRDAVAFLRAMRQRDEEVAQAQQDRQQKIQDNQLEGQRRRQELQTQQEQELADARLANERKLQDLSLSLDRELQAQAIAYSREQEQIRTKEERKLADLQTARERDIEDARRHYDQKLEDLKISLADELAILKEGNAALEDEAARHNDAMGDSHRTSSPSQAPPAQPTPYPANRGSTRSTPPDFSIYGNQVQNAGGNEDFSIYGNQIGHRAGGGFVTHGRPYIVGERGPELFRPNTNGMIVPQNALMTSGFSAPSVVSHNTYNNQKSASLGGLLDPQSFDALLQAKLENALVSILSRM